MEVLNGSGRIGETGLDSEALAAGDRGECGLRGRGGALGAVEAGVRPLQEDLVSTRNPKSDTRNPEPRTRIPNPESQSTHGTGNPYPHGGVRGVRSFTLSASFFMTVEPRVE